MTKAKMNWEPTQGRWRAKYKREQIQISARKLGGKSYDDTVVAANRYYDKRVAEIDLEIAQTILRPNEAEYLSELDSLTQIIRGLEMGANDPADRRTLEIVKSKAEKIRKALGNKKLPPVEVMQALQMVRRAIHRACDKADIPHWSPNRLRHATATAVTGQFSLAHAKEVLGHSSAQTIER